MATRRDARERAVQFLYHWDLNPAKDADAALALFWKQNSASAKTRAYAQNLVRGVLQRREAIDEAIRQVAEHWDIGRMGVVDRNILRLAVYEMLHCPDIPPVVSVNEGVDLAKYFCSRESGRFVNGLLDRICKSLTRPTRTAEGAETP